MDSFQHIRDRHETVIEENAKRIRDHIGYVLKRIESGHADTTGLYAEDIAASAQRIRLSVAALETLGETDKILQAGDKPGQKD